MNPWIFLECVAWMARCRHNPHDLTEAPTSVWMSLNKDRLLWLSSAAYWGRYIGNLYQRDWPHALRDFNLALSSVVYGFRLARTWRDYEFSEALDDFNLTLAVIGKAWEMGEYDQRMRIWGGTVQMSVPHIFEFSRELLDLWDREND